MHIEEIRYYCLSKPNVEETLPFGPDVLVYKVNNKIFLLSFMDHHPVQFNVKCAPDRAIDLREEFADAVLPGYHMNKKHWNTVVVNGRLTNKQLHEMIDDSYDLVNKSVKRKKSF